MTATTHLKLPFVAAAQAQKHVTVNESLRKLDALIHMTALGKARTAPPASPLQGARYLVPAAASGAWANKTNQIAAWQDGAWAFFTPQTGWSLWIADEAKRYLYNGSSWAEENPAPSAASPHGADTAISVLETEARCASGSFVNAAASIPSHSIVLGISGRVVEAITGPSSWQIGVAGSANRYGSGLGVQKNSHALGLTGQPQTYYSDTPVRITATGGAFRGGLIRLAIHRIHLTPPRQA